MQSAALEVAIIMDDQEQARREAEALKLALITADPAQYVPKYFPEFVSAPVVTQDPGDLIDSPEMEIEYDLTPVPSEEAASIIEKLLGENGGGGTLVPTGGGDKFQEI